MILGTVGVQGFFVLSGWLVTISFQRSPSVWRFLWHRILRLYPAMGLCLAITALLFAPLVYLTTPHLKGGFLSLDPGPFGYVFRNLFLPRKQIVIGMLLRENYWGSDWNGSLWTIFYEGSCYVIVAVTGLAGLLGRYRRFGLLLLLSVVATYLVWEGGHHPYWLNRVAGRLFDTPGARF